MTRHVLPTGSKWHRIWQCPPSAVRPQVVSDDREAKLEPARGRGLAIHKYLEQVKAVGKEQALADSPPELIPLLSALDLEHLPVHLSTEVAFAYNWKTGAVRELGRNLGHRDYDSLGVDWSCEIPCTLDVIGVQENEKGVFGFVGDYKTGFTRYPPPDKFGQTLLGGLCVRAIYKCTKVVLELIYIDEDGDHYPVRRVVDDWDLDIAERSFAKAMLALEQAEADEDAGRSHAYHEGRHCDYCDAFKNCGAKTAMVRAMPAELIRLGVKQDGTGALELTPGVITREVAANMFVAAEKIREAMGKVMTEVCGLAWSEPIPLADGRVIERYVTKKRDLDGRKAAAVLERRFGREGALEAIQIDVTFDSIRKLVAKRKAPDEKMETKRGDGALDVVLKEIENAGGIAANVSEVCKPHLPKKRKANGT